MAGMLLVLRRQAGFGRRRGANGDGAGGCRRTNRRGEIETIIRRAQRPQAADEMQQHDQHRQHEQAAGNGAVAERVQGNSAVLVRKVAATITSADTGPGPARNQSAASATRRRSPLNTVSNPGPLTSVIAQPGERNLAPSLSSGPTSTCRTWPGKPCPLSQYAASPGRRRQTRPDP